MEIREREINDATTDLFSEFAKADATLITDGDDVIGVYFPLPKDSKSMLWYRAEKVVEQLNEQYDCSRNF